ncbi:hypothetical protein AB0L82_33000 [Nocardia sp. NPDC052001]|uniref:hypothetical protein n=1 Tax=Nocardia sp. NPDC052001 TaxID=3154853 RepID=UPI00341A2AD1
MTSTTIEPEAETASSTEDSAPDSTKATPKDDSARQIQLSTVLAGVVVTVLVVCAGVFATLWLSARGDLHDRDGRAADDKHAQQIATDYALGASTIDSKNLKAWFDKLKTDTTPQLAAKFDATAPQLEQILMPLQWTSNATPITAVVTSAADGIRKVSVFVNVTSTSAQNPQGSQTTVTYALTIDQHADWKITDVGGLDTALPGK